VNSENAFEVLKAYLTTLWLETRPAAPLPPELAG
jgi:hypothetical protein